MRRRALASLLVLSTVVALSSAAIAKPKKGEKKAADDSATGGSADKIRRDPAGVTGISPYQELIVKGQNAYTSGDKPGAIAAFQEATQLEGDKMLGFYRLGEALRGSDKLDEASTAYETGLGKKGNAALKAKMLFVVADLRERQGKWQEAKDAWTAYATFLGENPKAGGFPATPADRLKMIERRTNDEKVYGEVKVRTEKRRVEVEKEAEDNKKKDTKNR
jgi:tetratricopeptide (TPR) repeat protein